jgi:putative aminopeptidase FrvX
MAKATAKKASTNKVSNSKKKDLLDPKAYQFLKEYINNPSPVGFESSGQKIWLNYLTQYVDTTFSDPYGTAVGVINPDAPFKVVIEAHADEISWFVNYVSDQGLIYLKRNGGVDHQIAPSMRVWIHGKKGPVKAVFGWPAIHTRLSNPEQKEPQPKVDNLTLDCGARSKKEVEALGIHIGAVVTYEEGFDELPKWQECFQKIKRNYHLAYTLSMQFKKKLD